MPERLTKHLPKRKAARKAKSPLSIPTISNHPQRGLTRQRPLETYETAPTRWWHSLLFKANACYDTSRQVHRTGFKKEDKHHGGTWNRTRNSLNPAGPATTLTGVYLNGAQMTRQRRKCCRNQCCQKSRGDCEKNMTNIQDIQYTTLAFQLAHQPEENWDCNLWARMRLRKRA